MKTLIKPVASDNEVEELYSAQCDEYTCEGINCECRSRCTFDWFSDDQNSSELIF